MPVRVLIEGRPGSGKTTVAARLAALLVESGVPVRGFVTHELREHGRRVGFDVESLEGERATLAHVSFRGLPRVGKYGVDLEAFERVALPALAARRRRGVVVIDELGKMELESERFREAVSKVVEEPADVVATVPIFRNPFTDDLKRRHGVEIVRVTRAGRDALPDELAARLAPGCAS